MSQGVGFVARLPSELMAQCFNYLTLEQLLPLCLVSSRWRQVALDSPAYWRTITLEYSTPGALQFFFLRLRRTLLRRFCVYISLWTGILPAYTLIVLGAYMADLSELGIYAQVDDTAPLLELLSLPAPHLERLILGVATDRKPIIRNLFSGVAPLLSELWLYGTGLDLIFLSPLPQVKRLTLYTLVNYVPLVSDNVFKVFPNLRHLAFQLNTPLFDPIYKLYSTWDNLEFLCLRQQGAILGDILRLPINRITHISVNNEGQALDLLQHLHPDESLELGVEDFEFSTQAMVVMHFTGLETKLIRSIVQPSLQEWQNNPYAAPDVLYLQDIMNRVTHLALTTNVLVVFALRLPALPNLQHLRIIVHDPYSWVIAHFPLNPRLRTIALRNGADSEMSLDCADLRRLGVLGFSEYFRVFPLNLHLEHFMLRCDGPERCCKAQFRVTVPLEPEHWSMPQAW